MTTLALDALSVKHRGRQLADSAEHSLANFGACAMYKMIWDQIEEQIKDLVAAQLPKEKLGLRIMRQDQIAILRAIQLGMSRIEVC